MPQTFYIEFDEEIISVIGRLRKSGSEKNFFVFPKRALVLQSIINLRLFQREAQKLGKKVVIVTQDEAGRAIAEKAGMETEQYSDDFSQVRTHVELAPQMIPSAEQTPVVDTKVETIAPHSDMIGSADFHTASQSPMLRASVSERVPTGQKLRVRNASPERQPSLNSVRHAEESTYAVRSVEPAPQRMMTDMAPAPPHSIAPASLVMPPSTNVPMPVSMPASQALPREERLRNFFADRGPEEGPAPAYVSLRPSLKIALAVPTVHMPAVVSRHAGVIFALLGVIAAVSAIGAAVVLFLPKATVHVTPHKTVQNTDIQFDAVAEGGMPADDRGERIAARIIEKDVEVTLSATATGTSGSSNQKARGTVVIANAYGKESQPLVATTRLETADGKVFRLTEGIVVPGMTDIGGKQTPGAIEASVIADQAGEAYNIGSTEFTIPGFKGSPKYAAFSAKSSKTFVGGSSTASDGMTVVSQADREKVESDAKAEAKSRFLADASTTLAAGEKILDESMDIVPQSPSAPQVGTAASSFEYKSVFHVRAFAFSEDEIRAKAESGAAKEVAGIAFHPVSVTLAYGEASADYDRRAVRVRAHTLITLESDVDADKFRVAIAGQDASSIEKILGTFSGIKKISVDFSPAWFVSSIPSSENRISVIVEPGEE
jgi:hypothetical protein